MQEIKGEKSYLENNRRMISWYILDCETTKGCTFIRCFCPQYPGFYKMYSLYCLLMAGKNDSLLIKTHEERKPNCTVKCIKM